MEGVENNCANRRSTKKSKQDKRMEAKCWKCERKKKTHSIAIANCFMTEREGILALSVAKKLSTDGIISAF